ncbi:hypothetical protein F5B21DRAFT_506333 [Xylaria acuta]|nr:hypothetical protein F5B21DRAFT_506333 [Xylaria acuta]
MNSMELGTPETIPEWSELLAIYTNEELVEALQPDAIKTSLERQEFIRTARQTPAAAITPGMALLGWSLILASVVYLAIRRPPFIETLVALCRGSPRIQQPPSTRSPSDTHEAPGRGHSSAISVARQDTSARKGVEADRNPIPKISSPSSEIEIEITTDEPTSAETPTAAIRSPPQSTPKATPATAPANEAIPSFSLSPSTATTSRPAPASAAAIARGATSPAAQPSLSAPTPTMSMPPPPPPLRPPGLSPVTNSISSLAPPVRPSPLPNRQYDRQPGTSTLAPPPTHSSKPAKPSRKVTLEPGHSPLDWARLANHPTADLRNLGSGVSYIRVTPSMLRRQTGRRGKDAWTALGGRVYNVSPYLPFHPGGEPELLRAAGRDGTKLFGEIHPWVNYETMLSSCLIGLLVDEAEASSPGDMEAMD